MSDDIMGDDVFIHKYSYLGKGAEIWDSISKDYYYNLGERELSTLEKSIKMAGSLLGSGKYNIVHLGSGNGVEIPIIVKSLKRGKIAKYFLVDISRQLLSLAKSFGEAYYKDITFSGFVKDITGKDTSSFIRGLKQSAREKNLIFLVGNGTLMSYPTVVCNVAESMDYRDRLFITLEVFDSARELEILEQYKLPNIIGLFESSLSVFDISGTVLNQYHFSYDKGIEQIRVYFNIAKWESDNKRKCKKFIGPLKEKVLVFTSYRPTAKHLKEYLIGKGFEIVKFSHFAKEHCCGVLCRIKGKNNE